MAEQVQESWEASPEQIHYANILEKGMLIGLLILFLTFALYVFGIMKPYVPLDRLTQLWSMPVHDYLETARIQPGWAWLGMLGYGDFVNFIGIIILAGVTIVCYAAIVPALLRNNDKIYAVIAVLEVLVLVVAASGLVAGGH